MLGEPVGRNGIDTGFRVAAVGLDADLGTSKADGFVTQRMHGHRHQRHAHLFAGRKEHIHFASRGAVGNLMGQID